MRCHAVGLIVSLIFGLLVVPCAVEAQSAANVPRIGLLSPHATGDPLGRARVDAFRQGLQDLGYLEGQTIRIEYRWAEGHPERLDELAADLVRLPVDIIVAASMLGIRAARRATATIPAVAASVSRQISIRHGS